MLENVFAFDTFDTTLRDTLRAAFEKHGIPLANLAKRSAPTRVPRLVIQPLPRAQLSVEVFQRDEPPSTANLEPQTRFVELATSAEVKHKTKSALCM